MTIMTPIENRHVERILSLLVILYGLWLIIPSGERLIFTTMQIWGQGWWSLFNFPVISNLSSIVAGCCLLLFFPLIARWCGYFATAERIRSERQWYSTELLAIPIVLFVFVQFLLWVPYSIGAIVMFVSSDVIKDHWLSATVYSVLFLFICIGIAAVVMRSARDIAVWLLRMAD